MSCETCTRLGRACVTSSLDKLDRVVEELSSKISVDEQKLELKLSEVELLLSQVAEIRRRIARNKVVRQSSNLRVEEQVRHAIDNLPAEGSNELLLEDISETQFGLENVGVASPFEFSLAAS